MLKCNQIIELTSKQQDARLFKWERMEMTVHLWMCRTCRHYAKQLALIQNFAKMIDKHPQSITLSADAKKRIQNKLKFLQKEP
jgi:predicted anti-sigma-YlaC factor YlaD